jgi:DNA polymerase V
MLGGVVGARLVRELQGYPCSGLHPSEDGTLSRQSIRCARTSAAVASFLTRAAEKLRAQGEQAYVLTVFVQKNRFDPRVPPPYSRSATLTLPGGPSADMRVLAQYAGHLLDKILESGGTYHKAGVVLDGLEPPTTGQQLGLFAPVTLLAETAAEVSADRPQLIATLDGLNTRFGRGTVRLGSTMPAGPAGVPALWQGQANWRSGAFTTWLDELLTVA